MNESLRGVNAIRILIEYSITLIFTGHSYKKRGNIANSESSRQIWISSHIQSHTIRKFYEALTSMLKPSVHICSWVLQYRWKERILIHFIELHCTCVESSEIRKEINTSSKNYCIKIKRIIFLKKRHKRLNCKELSFLVSRLKL